MGDVGFDARRYLTKLNGHEYLEVKWRLLWLRTQQPDAVITTDLVEHDAGSALFRADVRLPGGGAASGWGSETAEDFGDYIEKAETKALGRALAALGYGTQFCEDFSFGADGGRVVDAPVPRPLGSGGPRRRGPRATDAQVKALYAIGRDRQWPPDELQARSRAAYGRPPEELTKGEASQFIDALHGAAATR